MTVCKIKPVTNPTTIGFEWVIRLLESANFSKQVINCYVNYLNSDGQAIGNQLIDYKEQAIKKSTPLFIYHEEKNEVITLFASHSATPEDPGEQGSILAYARAYGVSDAFLCSDCYGQLSCSSCAVEVLAGELDNPTPREEEYDMLDIDKEKPPTQFTRLGCQAIVGNNPLVLTIRKPIKG
tara:strand:- start:5565 stop:6107 length:543 start_codon:yes stop_codon:yes gene_type:complete